MCLYDKVQPLILCETMIQMRVKFYSKTSDECSGNKFMACLLSDLESNDLQVKAVDCIMKAKEPHKATEEVEFTLFVEQACH